MTELRSSSPFAHKWLFGFSLMPLLGLSFLPMSSLRGSQWSSPAATSGDVLLDSVSVDSRSHHFIIHVCELDRSIVEHLYHLVEASPVQVELAGKMLFPAIVQQRQITSLKIYALLHLLVVACFMLALQLSCLLQYSLTLFVQP
ncbi:hypothetical protein R1flu_020997 [Riccia fluitans]|uniref:Uncharacterized protein n=1 Tax=Riccia fluitans TaxID=41844 RepID=A0ABD1ZRJ3_9MARC